MILYLILGIVIIILILIIARQQKEIKKINTIYENIKSDIQKNDDELEFTKREIERLRNQISIYEEKAIKKIIQKNKTKKISVKPIYKGLKALVGDYCEGSSNETKEVLNSFGFSVDIVRTGDDIVDRIENGFKYDIIFTNNTYLDGDSGTITLRRLQNIENFNIPIVIHTIDREHKDFFLDFYGFNGYIEKPVTPEKLKPVLDKIFECKKGVK